MKLIWPVGPSGKSYSETLLSGFVGNEFRNTGSVAIAGNESQSIHHVGSVAGNESQTIKDGGNLVGNEFRVTHSSGCNMEPVGTEVGNEFRVTHSSGCNMEPVGNDSGDEFRVTHSSGPPLKPVGNDSGDEFRVTSDEVHSGNESQRILQDIHLSIAGKEDEFLILQAILKGQLVGVTNEPSSIHPVVLSRCHLLYNPPPTPLSTGILTLDGTSVGGLQGAKDRLQVSLSFDTKGVILYGPPGAGKTLLAKCLSLTNTLIPISIPELILKEVGETEKAIGTLFERAKKSAPCVLFIDEIETLFGSDSEYSLKILTQFVHELDNLTSEDKVLVLGATNHLERLPNDLIRPGRLDRLIHVPFPDENDRRSILHVLCKEFNVSIDSKELDEIIEKTDGFSGADLKELIRRGLTSLSLQSDQEVTTLTSSHLFS